MNVKNTLKQLFWVLLMIVVAAFMIWGFQINAEKVRIYLEPDRNYYISLFWEILKGLVIFLPMLLLSFLGLARSFLGENSFPFAEKIPVWATKLIMVITVPLLVCVAVANTMYTEHTDDIYVIRTMMEYRFEAWRSTLAWILFYDILLYIEQRGILRNCSRKDIQKQQVWITVTIALTWMILFWLSCVGLWYIPLDHVGSPNTLEDYGLWWFSLYSAVFLLPFLFFSVRKVIRSFKNNPHWLTLSTIAPKKIIALIALVEAGLMAWQIQEWHSASAWVAFSEIPEYTEARVMKHLFLAMICGLTLFYTICLLTKQILAVCRVKRKQNAENKI